MLLLVVITCCYCLLLLLVVIACCYCLLLLFAQCGLALFLGTLLSIDTSDDGSVIVGVSEHVVIAHSSSTGLMLWKKWTSDNVGKLRIHGRVVIAAVDWYVTLLLDLPTGRTIYTLGAFGTSDEDFSFFVFDGLTIGVILLFLWLWLFDYWCYITLLGGYGCLTISFSLFNFCPAPLLKLALKADEYSAASGLESSVNA